MLEIIIFMISFLVTKLFLPFIRDMLLTANITGKNYKGEEIPVGIGMTFIPVLIVNGIVINYIFGNDAKIQQLLLIFLVGIMTMAAIGLIDDLIGNRDTLGFKGHIKALFKGKLTTGGLKAIIGGLISLLIGSMFASNIVDILINTLIIALFTNLINLLDLRPGRAIKGFLFISAIFFIIGITKEIRIILISILAYVLGYLPQDIKAKGMMGDVGSNALGITLGIISIVSYPMTVKYILLVILILVHFIAEKYSITKIIEKNSILKYLDELGRN